MARGNILTTSSPPARNRSCKERTQHTHNGPAKQIILPVSTFLHPQSLYWGEFRTTRCLSMQLASRARQEGCLSLQEKKRNNLCIASCEMIFPFLFLFFHVRKSKRLDQLEQLSPYWQLFAAVCSLRRSQAKGQGFSSCNVTNRSYWSSDSTTGGVSPSRLSHSSRPGLPQTNSYL